jgi:hypothetical protein
MRNETTKFIIVNDTGKDSPLKLVKSFTRDPLDSLAAALNRRFKDRHYSVKPCKETETKPVLELIRTKDYKN